MRGDSLYVLYARRINEGSKPLDRIVIGLYDTRSFMERDRRRVDELISKDPEYQDYITEYDFTGINTMLIDIKE